MGVTCWLRPNYQTGLWDNRGGVCVKILMITGTFPPRAFGGGTSIAYTLARKLVERGHEVCVYTTDVGNTPNDRLAVPHAAKRNGINVRYFRNVNNYLAFTHRIFLPLRMAFTLRDEIESFDVVHIHYFRTLMSVIAHSYAKKRGVPYVLHGHGSISKEGRLSKIKTIFDVLLGRSIIHDASKLIAVSNEEAQHYQQLGGETEKISVIYNGMDTTTFNTSHTNLIWSNRPDPNTREILYLGRLHKSKGLDFLIRSFAALLKDYKNIVLVIAGADDNYKATLERLVGKLQLNDNVRFLGYIEERDKPSVYAAADLFVHVVKYMGGVGLAPLESILCGTPVIVTDECGEIIKEARCGCIVPFGDVSKLKNAMKYLLENDEDARQMIQRGDRYIRDNLTWDVVIGRFEAIYRGGM